MSIRKLNKIATIVLDYEDLKKRAYDLWRAGKTYDEYIWIYAESDLRLKSAFLSKIEPNGTEIKLDTSKIVDKPSESEIRELARAIRGTNPSIQDLHWLIAERQYIYSKARGK